METEYQSRKNSGTDSGPCQSYNKKEGKLVQCTNQGTRRIDNGLDSGIHCDEHWAKLLHECRQRSW